MKLLVADVGGTNTRIAVASGMGLSGLARFENDHHGSFDEVLSAYLLNHDLPQLDRVAVAVAGPVTGDQARLTNRNWAFDVEALSSALPTPGTPVRLINDLAALGHALPALAADQLTDLHEGASVAANDQALVVGMGTGVNVCLLKGSTVFEAELGHASLPASVETALSEALGGRQSAFRTNEDLFSGRGLARLHQALSGQARRGQEILAEYDSGGTDQACATVELAAHLAGLFTRELVFQYLPFRGLYFAGGAARGLLGSSARDIFLKAFLQGGNFADHLACVPIRLISDDGAALVGVARFLRGAA